MRQRRGNEEAARWLRALLFVALTWWALAALSFTPAGAPPALALVNGAVALFAPGVAVLAAVVLVSLPVLAADLATGVALLIAGLAAIHFLGQGRGRVFLLIGYTFLLAALGPAWAIPVLAGFLLGSSEGAVVALLACLVLQAGGIITGAPTVGPVTTGASTAVLTLAEGPENLLTFSWLSKSLAEATTANIFEALSALEHVVLLVLQPLLWAASAAVTGSIRADGATSGHLGRSLLAVSAGVAVITAASVVSLALLAETPATADIALWGASALAVAVGFTLAYETMFPPLAEPAPKTKQVSLAAEDADVDELLRLISHAEDELAHKHTVKSVVMITDMKSFSTMTEEDGSMVSAKAIQRHRDLLVPVIAQHGGSGKSTGGDGLVAAFPDTRSALACAASMQRTLREYNASHPSERDIIIRTGIATGEVVLDRSGRPFIGVALNLAARVMNLADGGQVLVTRTVADAAQAAGVRTHGHGTFTLKNIGESTEVLEVLWRDGQQPVEPKMARE